MIFDSAFLLPHLNNALNIPKSIHRDEKGPKNGPLIFNKHQFYLEEVILLSFVSTVVNLAALCSLEPASRSRLVEGSDF